MTAAAFRKWRSRLGISQREAGELIGRTERMIRYYESGEKVIPKGVALACWAIKQRKKKPKPPTS